MNSHSPSEARGFFHRSFKLRFSVLIGSRKFSLVDRVRSRLINLDEVRAFFELLTYDRDQFVGVVGVVGIGQNVLRWVITDGVFVSAENVDGVAAEAQPRAGDPSFIDGVAHGRVGRARAFGAHVAFGGKAGHQVVSRGQRRHDRALRDGFLNGLQIFCAGMKKEMDVGIDQARE